MRVACWVSNATRLKAHALTRAPTPTPTHTHAHACTRLRALSLSLSLSHTHTQICNTYCFSTATVVRELASALRYTCIASDVGIFRGFVRGC